MSPHPPRALGTAVALCLAVIAAGCGEKSEPELSGPATPIDQSGTETGPGADQASGVRLRRIGQFDQPDFLAQAPGARDLYVVEQAGRIQRLPAGGGPPRTFLDISKRVGCCGERGLLSVAFAPDYARSHRFYVDYTDKAGDTRVVGYRSRAGAPDAGGTVADPRSATTILRVKQPFANHNGGLILFGPDERLYIGLGDGGSAGDPKRNAQSLKTDLGKLLRIVPDAGAPTDAKLAKLSKRAKLSLRGPYSVPRSNPFTKRKFAKPEIYAYGLRSPWRFSFDRKTGSLWIGDVGQDTQEEIDGVARADAAGANFGWSAFEGTNRFNSDQKVPGAIKPVLTYGRAQGCSVTGGYVVRDRDLVSLYGRYLYGDFCQGELRSFPATPGRPARDDRALGLQVPSLSSFAEDSSGQLYVLSLDGPVYRLEPQ